MGRDRLSLRALLAAVTLAAIGMAILRVFPAGADLVTDAVMLCAGVGFFGAAVGMLSGRPIVGAVVGVAGAALFLFVTWPIGVRE